ncbi:hypothetical protein GLYMA_12G042950v4 [Glycine max]|nr:hypothetical protein GLYMA_12G042950v4 [Glycine max]KAH1141534.1 hypothetical protein GYH30_032667 [Glycine max]
MKHMLIYIPLVCLFGLGGTCELQKSHEKETTYKYSTQ